MLNIQRGTICYVDLGFGEGSEIGKLRPCVVVQNDIGNLHSPTTIVLPITIDIRILISLLRSYWIGICLMAIGLLQE